MRKTESKREKDRIGIKKQPNKWKSAWTDLEREYLKNATSQSGKTKETWKNKG